jgi:hypothetical protein
MKQSTFQAETYWQKSIAVLAMLPVVLIATASCASSPSDTPTDFEEKRPVIRVTPNDLRPSTTPVNNAVTLPPDSEWNWQLTGELKMTVNAEVWDVDLFDTPPEEIAQLQQDSRYVICYFSAGSVEDWRPDASDVDEAAIGLPLDGWEGERWLDVRAESVLELAKSRLQLAAQKGCDAVEPDNVDGYSNKTGFELSQSDQIQFNRDIASAAHQQGLAVGLKNTFDLVGTLVGEFDFAVTEQCHEYDECELTGAFTEYRKPVFNAEYPPDQATGITLQDEYCSEADRLGIHTLILPLDLDGSWRISCG